jgi:hypothetical protein
MDSGVRRKGKTGGRRPPLRRARAGMARIGHPHRPETKRGSVPPDKGETIPGIKPGNNITPNIKLGASGRAGFGDSDGNMQTLAGSCADNRKV